ncbi:UNVERIFIED_CONTAM: hypothetical protein FKN15_040116 [Acipenser sinensis]
MSEYDIKNKAASLVQTYPSDLNEYFPSEMLQFTKFVSGKDKKTAFDLLQLILNSPRFRMSPLLCAFTYP